MNFRAWYDFNTTLIKQACQAEASAVPSVGGRGVARALLDAAVIAMAVRIFETQAHLWTIFLQVEQLLAIESSSALPGGKRRVEIRFSAVQYLCSQQNCS